MKIRYCFNRHSYIDFDLWVKCMECMSDEKICLTEFMLGQCENLSDYNEEVINDIKITREKKLKRILC